MSRQFMFRLPRVRGGAGPPDGQKDRLPRPSPEPEKTTLDSHHPTNSHCPFFFNDTATTEIYTLSLHDALPISLRLRARPVRIAGIGGKAVPGRGRNREQGGDHEPPVHVSPPAGPRRARPRDGS